MSEPVWDGDLWAVMERARMEAWRKVSPSSNLHSMTCGDDCWDPRHYPEGDPLDGYGDPDETTENMRRFLKET